MKSGRQYKLLNTEPRLKKDKMATLIIKLMGIPEKELNGVWNDAIKRAKREGVTLERSDNIEMDFQQLFDLNQEDFYSLLTIAMSYHSTMALKKTVEDKFNSLT